MFDLGSRPSCTAHARQPAGSSGWPRIARKGPRRRTVLSTVSPTATGGARRCRRAPPGELVEVREPGLRCEGGVVAGGAQDADGTVQLLDGLASEPLDVEQDVALADAFRVGVQSPTHPAGLQRHHADGMRDGVVQFAGDAGALGVHGFPRAAVALGGELGRQRGEVGAPPGLAPQAAARPPTPSRRPAATPRRPTDGSRTRRRS